MAGIRRVLSTSEGFHPGPHLLPITEIDFGVTGTPTKALIEAAFKMARGLVDGLRVLSLACGYCKIAHLSHSRVQLERFIGVVHLSVPASGAKVV